jgi:hypothetical protein
VRQLQQVGATGIDWSAIIGQGGAQGPGSPYSERVGTVLTHETACSWCSTNQLNAVPRARTYEPLIQDQRVRMQRAALRSPIHELTDEDLVRLCLVRYRDRWKIEHLPLAAQAGDVADEAILVQPLHDDHGAACGGIVAATQEGVLIKPGWWSGA